jgi:uroporphyrinogen decarboxylase
MNKRSRIKATLNGEEVDRPAVSFWRHFYKEEVTAEGLAEVMLGFQRKYDWDFMKVNPRAEYHVEDWGNTYEYSGNDFIKPRFLDGCIKSAEDWKKLQVLPPDKGVLGEHLKALELIAEGLGREVFFVMTVFTPLSIAWKLVNDLTRLIHYINEAPEALLQGLEVITATFVGFTRACLDRGASGVFLATTECARKDLLSKEQYNTFGRRYDLEILDAARNADFNILHVCKSNNMLSHLLDYPVHALNWDAVDPTNPMLGEILRKTDKAVIGGIDQVGSLKEKGPEKALKEAEKACDETGGKRWMLGGGCTFSPEVKEENLISLRKVFDPTWKDTI